MENDTLRWLGQCVQVTCELTMETVIVKDLLRFPMLQRSLYPHLFSLVVDCYLPVYLFVELFTFLASAYAMLCIVSLFFSWDVQF